MSIAQLNNGDGAGDTTGAATAIGINAGDLVDAAVDPDASPRKLTSALLAVGLLTLAMDIATALYKPPRGAVFERRRLAYYLTLAGIFAAGAAEVSAAFWLSCSGPHAQHGGRRRVALVRALLCASLLPLVFVIALGGSSVLNS
ncbi:unnamed protein product [Urochloa decumbens]|uniref:Uncharacterized protein n=1 Tax=Urochloa decumbens TaxID=240449 RepID=A0ABC8ZCK8_9POAL